MRDRAAAIEDLLALPGKVDALAREISQMRVEVAKLHELAPPMLVSVSEASRRLGISEKSVQRHLASGRLPPLRIGRAVKVDLAVIRRALELRSTIGR